MILSTLGLNTLMFKDPYAKICYTSLLASQFDNVIYVDLDTVFTAYFMAGLIDATNHLDIYLPSEGKFTFMIKEVVASMQSRSVVIFDSVNSFYNMFRMQGMRIGNLNHLLSVIIMLLVRQGIDTGVPILATSMLRHRKVGGWIQSPASRRLLQHKSSVRLSVEIHNNKDVAVKIVEHESIPAGTELIYNNSIITL
jgi:hypothetical protein